MARLLQRLYVAEQGVISFDGYLIGNFSPEYLRRQVGVVMQESYLFNRTVRENIAHSRPTASLSEVVEAASLAGAHNFILALPLGYDTLLSEGEHPYLAGNANGLRLLVRCLLTPAFSFSMKRLAHWMTNHRPKFKTWRALLPIGRLSPLPIGSRLCGIAIVSA